jgi:ATP-binding cassette subfamily C (CFTR/MRP) protein 1
MYLCCPALTLTSGCQIIYKKALVLSSDERGRASGDIVNMMSVDAVRLQELCTYGLTVISGPLQVCMELSE